MLKKINKQSVRFKTVYYCTSLNATRHHRCGNETKSDGLVLRKSASVFVTWLTDISANNKPWLFVSLGSGCIVLTRTCCCRFCLRPPEISIWTEKKREVRGKFFRRDVVILGFRVRLMTLQKFSSDHAPSKSPFDQSPPLLLVSQRVSDHRRALVSG